MINFYLCIIWPVIIAGLFFAYRFGKKRGWTGALLLLAGFICLVLAILWLIFGSFWPEILWVPYFAQ